MTQSVLTVKNCWREDLTPCLWPFTNSLHLHVSVKAAHYSHVMLWEKLDVAFLFQKWGCQGSESLHKLSKVTIHPAAQSCKRWISDSTCFASQLHWVTQIFSWPLISVLSTGLCTTSKLALIAQLPQHSFIYPCAWCFTSAHRFSRHSPLNSVFLPNFHIQSYLLPVSFHVLTTSALPAS